MAESSFQIIAGNGATAAIVAFATTNATTFVMQSIPTDNTGAVAWGTAGAPNANIMTVQGTTSGGPLPVSGGTSVANITQVGGSAVALGQVTMASSIPVVFASNQSALTAVVSGTVTAILSNPITAIISGTVTSVLSNPITAVVSGTVTAVLSNPITAVVSGTVSVSGLGSTPATFTSVIATSGSPITIAVKNTSGTLYNVSLYCNNSTNPVFLKIYNITAAGVNSSIVPFWTIGVPPGAPNNPALPSNGVAMGGTGISYLITKLVGSNDTTAVQLNDIVGGLGYI